MANYEIKVSAESLQRFKNSVNDYNQYNGIVEGLIERDYHLKKSVNDLTNGEVQMYEELAQKVNYTQRNRQISLGADFYLCLQPIYRVLSE